MFQDAMQAALVIIAVYVLIAVCVISTTEHAVSKSIKLIKVSAVKKKLQFRLNCTKQVKNVYNVKKNPQKQSKFIRPFS